MNIILFGPPGAGKGTQSSKLISEFQYTQLSTGNILREAILNKTELGSKAKLYMDKGELVPDSLVLSLVSTFLHNSKGPFILDGYPRNVDQAKELEKISSNSSLFFEKAIFLDVPFEELINRLTSRKICADCGMLFNSMSTPEKILGRCDKCGGEVIQRSDDRIDVVRHRLEVYEKYTTPLMDYYKSLSKLVIINGMNSTDNVYDEIKKVMNL